MKGISFLLSIGQPVWFKYQRKPEFIRLGIGPFSFILFFLDMDMWIAMASKQVNE